MSKSELVSRAIEITVTGVPRRVRSRIMAVLATLGVHHEVAFNVQIQLELIAGLQHLRQQDCKSTFPVFLNDVEISATCLNRLHAHLFFQTQVVVFTQTLTDIKTDGAQVWLKRLDHHARQYSQTFAVIDRKSTRLNSSHLV